MQEVTQFKVFPFYSRHVEATRSHVPIYSVVCPAVLRCNRLAQPVQSLRSLIERVSVQGHK